MSQRRGILLPFRITPGDADVATGIGPELRKTHLGVVLGMRASSAGEVGELAWDPDRGSRLDALRNAAASTAVEDFAAVYVQEALLLAMPEEVLLSLGVELDERTITLTPETKLANDTSPTPRTLTVPVQIKR